jgi:hypothetical protein
MGGTRSTLKRALLQEDPNLADKMFAMGLNQTPGQFSDYKHVVDFNQKLSPYPAYELNTHHHCELCLISCDNNPFRACTPTLFLPDSRN